MPDIKALFSNGAFLLNGGTTKVMMILWQQQGNSKAKPWKLQGRQMRSGRQSITELI